MGAGQWCPFDEIHNCFIVKAGFILHRRVSPSLYWRLATRKYFTFEKNHILFQWLYASKVLAHSLERVDGPVWLSLASIDQPYKLCYDCQPTAP